MSRLYLSEQGRRIIKMLKVMQDLTLTPEQLAQRKARRHLLLAQADILCQAYKAGQLREILDVLKKGKGQYVSHSKHSQQNGGNR